MTKRDIKITFVLSICILLLFSSNVFAKPLFPGWPEPPVRYFEIIGDRLEMTSPTTGTFRYKLLDENRKDITSEFPLSDTFVEAKVSKNGWDVVDSISSIFLEPQTGTCTLSYESMESYKYVKIFLSARYSGGDSKTLVIGNADAEDRIRIDEIHFLNDSLTKTGPNTATFDYQIKNYYNPINHDITREIPASQIEVISPIDSDVTLDPFTGTGIITFNTPGTNQPNRITLKDKRTGVTAVLNTFGLGPAQSTTPSAIARIDIVSNELKETEGDNTRTFQYKIFDHQYSNITKTIPATDLVAKATIGSSNAEISLDPSTGTGTITYDYSDNDQQVLVSLMHKKGIGASGLLNLVDSESENVVESSKEDLQIAKISFLPTNILKFDTYAELQYRIHNKKGEDITPKIPASRLTLSSSVNSMIVLKPYERGAKIYYNLHDSEKTIIVSIEDKATGVKTAINIGNMPQNPEAIPETDVNADNPDTDVNSDNTVITFKDPNLEKAIRALIYKPIADIYVNDVRNISRLYVDKGCTDLSGIENLTGLGSLDINTDLIKDLSPLKKLSKLRNLKCIGAINDLKTLEELTNLKMLELQNTNISSEDLISLQKALPDCYILYH